MTSPTRVAILELDGDVRIESVKVRLEIGHDRERPSLLKLGELPACPAMMTALDEWRDRYRHLGQINRALRPQEIVYEGRLGPVTPEVCRSAAQDLITLFQAWLAADSFRPIDEQLREEFNRYEPIQVSIRTRNYDLQRLPWHYWRFIERYTQAEIGLSAPLAELPTQQAFPRHHSKVRILAILGHSEGIDIETDRRLLNAIPGAEVCFLATPGRAHLSQSLWDEPWDILFFAGHSTTSQVAGHIYLGPRESLTLGELKNSLRRAIRNGLQLAIFNSCDGLGLAYELEQLNIPQMIVMREPVPDQVAQAFLKGFLQAFSQGRSLYEAVREARERLEGVEGDFPCASWLPVIYENPAVPTFRWSTSKNLQKSAKSLKLSSLLVPLMVTCLVLMMRFFGLLQIPELKAYDHLISNRPPVINAEERVLAVLVRESDIQYQRRQDMDLQGSLSDDALLRLLKKFEPYQPRVIGLDIYHDFPFNPELEEYLKRYGFSSAEKFISSESVFSGDSASSLDKFKTDFFAICQAEISESNLPGIPPPENLPNELIGFSNFPLDPDGVVRRQLFGMSPDSICPTSQSLSFQMVWNYLDKENVSGISAERDKEEALIIKSSQFETRFERFRYNSGGYRLPYQEAQGYQTLINYRPNNIRSYSLEEILNLNEYKLSNLVADKMIFIGVDRSNVDEHSTPLNFMSEEKLPGVLVHAQIASDILSATLDSISTMQWWSEVKENVWIAAWTTLSWFILSLLGFFFVRLFILFLLSFILYGTSFYFIVNNVWVPLIPCMVSISLIFLVLEVSKRFKETR